MSITIQFVQFYGVCWSKKFQFYEVCWSKPQVADSCILIHKNEDQHTFSIYKIHESAIFSNSEVTQSKLGSGSCLLHFQLRPALIVCFSTLQAIAEYIKTELKSTNQRQAHSCGAATKMIQNSY